MLLAAPLPLFANEPVSIFCGTAIRHLRQPQAAVDADGAIYIAFRADESIYVSNSTDRGRTYGEPVVWISRRPGDLWLLAPGAGEPHKLAEEANAPMVVATALGEGPVVVVWKSAEPHAGLRAQVVYR